MIDRPTERPAGCVETAPGAGAVLAGEVVGSALARVRPAEVAALRRRPGPVPEGWARASASLLRYSDEQTVAGTAAVFAAIEGMGVGPDRFEGWGVVAASRYLGRASLASALRSFRAEGVWGTSPHLIPHFALHSPSGTISLALGLRGPNVGAGGGLHATAEGFLAALTWLAGGVAPGVWLVLSGWSPELVPRREGRAVDDGECQALALALRTPGAANGPEADRPRFRIRIGGESPEEPVAAPVDLARLAADLDGPAGPAPRTVATDPVGRMRVELAWEGQVGNRG